MKLLTEPAIVVWALAPITIGLLFLVTDRVVKSVLSWAATSDPARHMD